MRFRHLCRPHLGHHRTHLDRLETVALGWTGAPSTKRTVRGIGALCCARSLYERAGFTYQRPKGKNHTVMRWTVAAA